MSLARLRPMLLALLGLTQITGAPKNIASPKPYDVAESYEVYSAILLGEISNPNTSLAEASTIFVRAETESFNMCLQPDEASKKVIGTALDDYLKINDLTRDTDQRIARRTWLLQRKFDIDKPYELITSDELRVIFQDGQGGWETFHKRHPTGGSVSGGWFELSAVGFNADKTVAAVYFGYHCGGLCGHGAIGVLQKKDGKWLPLQWNGQSCSWWS